MAKEASKFDEMKYQAEQIVRHRVEQSPEYKTAVRQTVKEIKRIAAGTKITVKKK